ncbi:serine hydrolase domain-containing protein [Paraferrimonas sedimenticola]|uniref:6-aminohexanoate-dimer hydrolase n=1 Tax=Paraferrimonas sedimenticola TaxID=375674 RepID=A0AA37VXY6_9GAMM|nr:serine hydrolase [Paraferrimonas sedimenticola]GLP95440.1 6-aminohexanoate-dimer hydrolase [Paraferrimonas sedimenticola]
MKKSLLCVALGAALVSNLGLATPASSAVTDNPYATAQELELMQGFPVPADKQVTKANALQTPPFNRWAYQHMRMFYPSAGIPAADKPVPLDKAIDSKFAASVKVANADGEMRSFDQFMTETWADAIVVIKGDKVIFEEYRNGMHSNQPHQMMSVTKSFGGLMAMMNIHDGRFSESQRVGDIVPELKSASAFGDATVGQVLDMTNSMDFREDYADPSSGIRTYGAVLGWTEKLQGVDYPTNLYAYLQTLQAQREHKHGDVFHYQTPKTDVVNWVNNRVTNQSFQEDMYNKLWSKLGTEGETYVLLDDNATLVAGGGLNATPANLARFATMMLNDGVFNGEQVVPKAIVEQLAAGGDRQAFANSPDASDNMPGNEWSYRAQWWVSHTPGYEAFTAIGIHGQWLYIDRERDVAIVKVSSAPESFTPRQERYDLNGLRAIVDYVSAN